eukprot:CAMPEP_0172519220 /NCGR_PEP_ID=MMETSP1066-20121228/291286_1 /TAXON_ID=671091 /ORGANISM="Coscinodiscus wailesii, Strain CCMP2513" /LENGTH=63 /DNA_ID=CAMNT_0013301763 /DNA_START=245 /DNA_END=436 /DNA_ORIENTATION=-
MICCRVFIMNHVFSTIGAGIILFEPSKNALFVKKVTTVPGKAHGEHGALLVEIDVSLLLKGFE